MRCSPRSRTADEPPRVVKLAVREMPRSGKPEEFLAAAGIDAEHIARGRSSGSSQPRALSAELGPTPRRVRRHA